MPHRGRGGRPEHGAVELLDRNRNTLLAYAEIANHQLRLHHDLDMALILHDLAVAAGVAVAILSLFGHLGATFVAIAVVTITTLAATEAVLLANTVFAAVDRHSAIEPMPRRAPGAPLE
jgi:hypothetical protein